MHPALLNLIFCTASLYGKFLDSTSPDQSLTGICSYSVLY